MIGVRDFCFTKMTPHNSVEQYVIVIKQRNGGKKLYALKILFKTIHVITITN